jgi:ribosomal-protein-alanine N-acetyltransferase
VDGCVSRDAAEPRADLVVRPAEPTDVDALLALEHAVFEIDRLERRSFRHAVRSPTVSLLVAEAADQVVAYAMILRRRGSAIAHLGSIAVAHAATGMGVGKQLLTASESEAAAHGGARLRLEVRDDNAVAQQLYETMGYERIGRIEDYYEDGAAAWRYEKELSAATGKGASTRRSRKIKARRARSDRHRAADR